VAVVEDAPVRSHVPKGWNFSRLVKNLVELEAEQGLMRGLMDPLRTKLMEVLPDYGVHLGGDGKAVTSHSTGQRSRKTGYYSDPDADWGKHETRSVDRKPGKAWSQVKSWFGYGLHVIADTHHELPVAYRVTRASAAEQPVMKEMLRNRSRRVRP